jgi:hypothetical protein
MKVKKYLMNLWTRIFCALLAGMIFIPAVSAQEQAPRERRVESRYLFIFDTSSAMKKRLPAEEKALHELFALSLSGEFRPGDGIGVWIFNKELRTGVFPLQYYRPQDAITLPGEMAALLKQEHYSKSTRFDELIPMMNRLVTNSPRLTVIIFCDGDGAMKGTTADDSINAEFKQNYNTLAKAREPFILIFRSQFGKFVGYTLSPADSIAIPKFPPLPPLPPTPVAAAPAPAPASPPTPVVPPPNAPALIIIGNNVGTNFPSPATATLVAPQSAPVAVTPSNATQQSSAVVPSASPASASTPAMVNAAPETNSVAVSPPVATNAIVSMTEPAKPSFTLASAASLPRESAGGTRGSLLFVCGGFAIMAGATLFLILRHSRTRHTTSLITESLKKR